MSFYVGDSHLARLFTVKSTCWKVKRPGCYKGQSCSNKPVRVQASRKRSQTACKKPPFALQPTLFDINMRIVCTGSQF